MKNESVFYQNLIDRVINCHFSESSFTERCFFKWHKPTQKERKDYLKATGKSLKPKKFDYRIIETFKNKKLSKNNDLSFKSNNSFTSYSRILISPIEDNLFDIIIDSYVGPGLGGITKTKFLLYESNCSECNIKSEVIIKISSTVLLRR
jgi:hypothetical protein